MSAKELSTQQLAEVAQYLAEATASGGWDSVSLIFNKLGLPSNRPNLSKELPDLWVEVVRQTYSGASKSAGHGSNAMTILLEVVCQEFPGNTQLANLAHSLATAAPRRVHKGKHGLFLSSASADIAAIEDLRVELLANDPTLNIFLAYKKMVPSYDWLNNLRDNLSSESVFVAWATPSYINSPFCSTEIGLAETAGARVFLVVVQPPGVGHVANLPDYLSSFQCYPYASDMPALAHDIVANLGEPA